MALTGQAKTDYQREYMRMRRSNTKSVSVRPKTSNVRPQPVRPKGISDNQWAYIQSKKVWTVADQCDYEDDDYPAGRVPKVPKPPRGAGLTKS